MKFFSLLLYSYPLTLPCHAFSRSVVCRRHDNNIGSLLKPPLEYLGCIKLFAGRQRRSSHNDTAAPSKDRAMDNLSLHEEEARQRRTGQAKQRLEKSVRREERISILEERGAEDLSTAERAELEGLLRVREEFEEQYDPLSFTKDHIKFKSMHNDALIALTRYCERQRTTFCGGGKSSPTNVFFLDGPDGGTAKALINRGNFQPQQCFVANRHHSTCDALRKKVPEMNVVHATAAEALTIGPALSFDDDSTEGEKSFNLREDGGVFSSIDFTAYYFDGCGGFAPHIINMLSAALIRDTYDARKPIAVGYSLLGGNKDVVSKELAISQALSAIARKRSMVMVHALDDPLRYGISLDIKKVGGSGGGGTFTTWILLEPKRY